MNFIKIICNSFEERDFIHKQGCIVNERKCKGRYECWKCPFATCNISFEVKDSSYRNIGLEIKTDQRRNIMENKEMYTKQEVVEMLKDMQRETGECVGFFVGQVSQLWVIKDLIEKRLNDMGETGVEVRVSK